MLLTVGCSGKSGAAESWMHPGHPKEQKLPPPLNPPDPVPKMTWQRTKRCCRAQEGCAAGLQPQHWDRGQPWDAADSLPRHSRNLRHGGLWSFTGLPCAEEKPGRLVCFAGRVVHALLLSGSSVMHPALCKQCVLAS